MRAENRGCWVGGRGVVGSDYIWYQFIQKGRGVIYVGNQRDLCCINANMHMHMHVHTNTKQTISANYENPAFVVSCAASL